MATADVRLHFFNQPEAQHFATITDIAEKATEFGHITVASAATAGPAVDTFFSLNPAPAHFGDRLFRRTSSIGCFIIDDIPFDQHSAVWLDDSHETIYLLAIRPRCVDRVPNYSPSIGEWFLPQAQLPVFRSQG